MTYSSDESLGEEGFAITTHDGGIEIKAKGDAGFLYGIYRLIRMMQCEYDMNSINVKDAPKLQIRILNHWDPINKGKLARDLGVTIWDWNLWPDYIDPKYEEYARFNASIGINGIVMNNVNAKAEVLRNDYLEKIVPLAALFRKYNIKIYLAANFAAPKMIGSLSTTDPLNSSVQQWWNDKADEIYKLIPDFGGYVVKANSEGQPGPQDYGRSHADGANMMARSVKSHGGIIMWRTFVYNDNVDADRMKRSYKEFMPLDGQFDDNVVLQTKYGPLDFQPTEPVQPLFGGIMKSSMFPELQIKQEYLGHTTYLMYLLPLWKEFLDFDTHCRSQASCVKDLITDTAINKITGIAGVANVGDTLNWTSHHFAQANWYAFGRLAWNPYENSEVITNEWIKTTWQCSDQARQTMRAMMEPTWLTYAQSHTPYAMGLTMNMNDHFSADFPSRAGNYWKINKYGIGNDRTSEGSDYVSQYHEPNRSMYNSLETCPELYLLSFHMVDWTHLMKSGMTLYDELMSNLEKGVELVNANIDRWDTLEGEISPIRFAQVKASLQKELDAATAFRNSAVDYFKKYAPTTPTADFQADLTSFIENNDFEYRTPDTKVPAGTIARGIPSGWTAYVNRDGQEWWQTVDDGVNTTALPRQSYGINQGANDIHGTNVFWINTTPMPDALKLYQTIPASKLGKGKYRVICTLSCVANKLTNVRLYANNVSQYYGWKSDYGSNIAEDEDYSFANHTGCSGNDGDFNLYEMSVDVELSDGEDLELGIKSSCFKKDNSKATDNSGWFKVDYFRLYRLKEANQDTSVEAYLYNPASRLWLQNNDRLTNQSFTRAEIGSRGLPFILTPTTDGYCIKAQTGQLSVNPTDLALSNNVSAEWCLTPVGNGYRITIDDKVLTVKEADTEFMTDNIYTHHLQDNRFFIDVNTQADDNSQWLIVTPGERMARLSTATAEQPQDATWLIADPDFSDINNTYARWKLDTSGGTTQVDGDQDNETSLGNRIFNSGSSTTLQLDQTIENIPNGTYQLNVQGYYRDGLNGEVVGKRLNGTETVRASYYLNDQSALLLSILDEAKQEKVNALFDKDGGSNYFFPSGQKAASRAFNKVYAYVNPAITATVTDNTLRLGIIKEQLPSGSKDFIAIDNFRLQYLGDHSSGIGEQKAKTPTLTTSQYYNLQGQKVDRNYKGLVIGRFDNNIKKKIIK